MKSFKFNLEGVLRYKEILLDEAKKDYAAAMGRVRQKETELNNTRARIRAVGDEYNERGARGIRAYEAYNYSGYIFLLDKKAKVQAEELARLVEEAEKKKAFMIERNRDFRSIEILKETRLAEYNSEYMKYEEKLIEEFVTNTNASAKAVRR